MKVFELIELLKEMPQDLQVYSMCDHGQTPEISMSPSVFYIDPENADTYGNEADEESGCTHKIVIL
jgi:hypothetical protein